MSLFLNRSSRVVSATAFFISICIPSCRERTYSATAQHTVSNGTVIKQFQNKFAPPQGLAKLPIHTAFNLRQWIESVLPLQLGIQASALPASHPATAVASSFVKRAHAGFLRAFPYAGNIPEPQAVILDLNENNAFNTPAPYCIPVPIISEKTTESGSWIGMVNGALASSDDVKMVTASLDETAKCPNWAPSRPELAPQIAEAMRIRNPTCDVKFVNGKIQMKHECLEPLNYGKSSPGVMALASGAGAVLFSGLMRNLSEGQFEAVLAHELGHYYRAHGLGTALKMLDPNSREFSPNYFYKTMAYTRRHTNPPEITSPEFTEMNDTLKDIRGVSFVARFAGAKLHPVTLALATRMVENIQTFYASIGENMAFNAKQLCTQFVAKSHGLNVLSGSDGMEPGRWRMYQPLYIKAEQLGLQCISALSNRSFESFRQTATAAGKGEIFEKFMAHMRSFASSKNANNAQEILAIIETASQEDEARWIPVTQRARAMGFGIYNSETEADELAAYLLAIAGSDPRDSINLFFRFLGVYEQSPEYRPGALPNLSECRMGYLNNWNHWVFKGQPWVPFFGATDDPHPNTCFRVWNVDTEIRSFGLPPSIEGRKSSAEYIAAVRALPPLPN